MLSQLAFAALAAVTPAFAASAQTFVAPAPAPTAQSDNYAGKSNGTITNGPLVSGASFDRIIQIWIENTDYATCESSPFWQNLTQQGVIFSASYGATHPSQPNYIAALGGTHYGLHDDEFRALPTNASSIIDLLEEGGISWASYQENMPYDGYSGFNYTQENYLTGEGDYTYYVRKHSATAIYSSVEGVESRALRRRNFNDLAADIEADALSQWVFITPNLVDDGHDTDIEYVSSFLDYFLVPLLDNPSFNNDRALILLTFDEAETWDTNNRIYTLALGHAIPDELVGTTDPTFYTHYSSLSTVQANWGLGSLGRQDTNKTVSNVYSWVANATGYVNNDLSAENPDALPLMNETGAFAGPLNPDVWTPVLAPNMSAIGAGGGAVFVSDELDTGLTSHTPLNLTMMNATLPASVDPGYDYSTGSLVANNSSSSSSSSKSQTSNGDGGGGGGNGENGAVRLASGGAGAGAVGAFALTLSMLLA